MRSNFTKKYIDYKIGAKFRYYGNKRKDADDASGLYPKVMSGRH